MQRIAAELMGLAKEMVAAEPDLAKTLGPRFRFVPALSWGNWAVYKFYDRGDLMGRREQLAERTRKEVKDALDKAGIGYGSVESRTDGRSRYRLDVDVYVIIEGK